MLRTEISGVHAPVDDKLKRYIRRRIGGLDRYVPRAKRKPTWAEVKLKESGHQSAQGERNECNCEVLLHVPEETITVCETTVNMYAAVDIAQEKLKHRIRKYKETTAPHRPRRLLRRQRKATS